MDTFCITEISVCLECLREISLNYLAVPPRPTWMVNVYSASSSFLSAHLHCSLQLQRTAAVHLGRLHTSQLASLLALLLHPTGSVPCVKQSSEVTSFTYLLHDLLTPVFFNASVALLVSDWCGNTVFPCITLKLQVHERWTFFVQMGLFLLNPWAPPLSSLLVVVCERQGCGQ